MVQLAHQVHVTQGRKLRFDGTVVQTAIHHPTDSSLLTDGVRVLSRLIRRSKPLVGDQLAGVRDAFRTRLRTMRRGLQQLHRLARRKGEEAVDTKAGYVYDSTRLNQLRPGWGLLPAPGKAQVYLYPDCKDGRVVADVVRLDKGHTEGLEPKVTEELVKLMLSAKGGKIQQSH